MRRICFIVAMCFSSAFAKVTPYLRSEVIALVVASEEIQQAELEGAAITAIAITEVSEPLAFQAFEVTVTLTSQTPVGERSCYTKMKVLSVNSKTAPAGITASELSEPILLESICQK